jgi:hypothetical protein
MSEDVLTTDLVQEDTFGCIIQKSYVVPERIVIALQQNAQNVMFKTGGTAILQPDS